MISFEQYQFRAILMMNKKSLTSGFTLIELISVIVILGVLAAFAIPKFANFGTDARKSTVEYAAASLESALHLARAEYLIAGGDVGAGTNHVPVSVAGGITIQFYAGWPHVSNSNFEGVGGEDVSLLLDGAEDFNVQRTIGWAEFSPKDAASPSTCRFRYTQATPIKEYTLFIDVSDCS